MSSRSTLTGRAAVLLFVVAVLAVSYASSAQAWLKQRSEISALTTDISQRKASVAELEQLKLRWHDDAYIETQARARLGWVMPGEVGYRVLDDDGSVLSDGGSTLSRPVGAAPGAAEQQWWERAWGTVVEAGRDPADAQRTSSRERRPVARIGKPRSQSSQRPR